MFATKKTVRTAAAFVFLMIGILSLSPAGRVRPAELGAHGEVRRARSGWYTLYGGATDEDRPPSAERAPHDPSDPAARQRVPGGGRGR